MSMRQIITYIGEVHERLDALTKQIEALSKTIKERSEPAASYTIKQWRGMHSLSEAQYYKLRREGRGPRLMSVGSEGVRISRQADLDWIAEREHDRVAMADKIERRNKGYSERATALHVKRKRKLTD